MKLDAALAELAAGQMIVQIPGANTALADGRSGVGTNTGPSTRRQVSLG